MLPPPPPSTLFPYTTLFRSRPHQLHALQGSPRSDRAPASRWSYRRSRIRIPSRSEEQTSELQSQFHLVCRLLLEKKNTLSRRTAPRSRPCLHLPHSSRVRAR